MPDEQPQPQSQSQPPYEQRHWDLADRIIVTSLRKSAGVDAGPALRAAMAEELAKAEQRGRVMEYTERGIRRNANRKRKP